MVPPSLTQSRPHHRPSDLARPAILNSTVPTATASRYKIEPGTSTKVPRAPVKPKAHRPTATASRYKIEPGTSTRVPGTPATLKTQVPTLSAPRVKREPGTSTGVGGTPATQQSQGPTARTSRVKAQPGTSRVKAEPGTSSTRPPSHLGTVNTLPNTTSAHSTGQAQWASEIEGLLRLESIRPPTMPPVWLPSEDGSDYDSSSEEQGGELSFLGMAESQLPNMQPRPNAMAEIASLLNLPDIDVPPEDRAKTPPPPADEHHAHGDPKGGFEVAQGPREQPQQERRSTCRYVTSLLLSPCILCSCARNEGHL